jgi:tRNA nucleotidyltransferase (CCA-adding enzyme)
LTQSLQNKLLGVSRAEAPLSGDLLNPLMPMDVVLCHRTADFDALGAAVGYACLHPGTRIVLCGGTHPAVKDFLALYRDEYPLIERRSVAPDKLRTVVVVDAQRRELLEPAAAWLDLPQVQIELYDHHIQTDCDFKVDQKQVEAVGATTTLLVEQLQQQQTSINGAEATVMALGIHVDTGSLTFEHATVRDAAALTWLMQQGANQRAIAEYIEPGFSSELQTLLSQVLPDLKTITVQGYRLAWGLVSTRRYVPGLSSLASQLMILNESDALLLGHCYKTRSSEQDRLTIIGRSRIDEVDLATLLQSVGGGGHPQAAAATLATSEAVFVLTQLFEKLECQVPPPAIAAELMSSPVRTILPDTTIEQAQRILLRYGHSGLSVVDTEGQLVGILSRRDLDIALHHGFSHAPVKGYMKAPVHTITPETTLPDIEALMVTYDIGRLPVVQAGQLIGIVTRTDILRQLHHLKRPRTNAIDVVRGGMQQRLEKGLSPALQNILKQAALQAQQQGWQLYLVGGAVRDLWLAADTDELTFREFDLVVDGIKTTVQGAGGELATALKAQFPEAQVQIYGQFQTASLIWPEASSIGPFSVDIATARSEFYPYPAANPEVSASSIRQDLYRRDFTVNALAIRLTEQGQYAAGELLDFFGGLQDLRQRLIRVLHPNSFIEDPTRIFRAIRFATRLQFTLEPQTEAYIHTAIASGIYQHSQDRNGKTPALQTRLRNELKYIFRLSNWPIALQLMESLGALQCLHPHLTLPPTGARAIRTGLRWLAILDPDEKSIERWLFILEALLLNLSPSDGEQAIRQLHLPETSQTRLQWLWSESQNLQGTLQAQTRPSQIVQQLQSSGVAQLVHLALDSPILVRAKLWHYLTQWCSRSALLNGKDLLQLGYPPGPTFKTVLEAVHAATLDGDLQDKPEAIAFVQSRFPEFRPRVDT